MIETALEYEGDVALVIATPVKPAEWIPPPGMWEAVRAACDRHGTLLIFDEVACGLGKTGRMFASEHEVVDVVPDILVTGKALGGGIVPLAAVTARDELDVGAEIAIGHYTHEKNPILAAAALATLDVLEDDHLVERAAELGHQALKLGAALVQRHALVTEVRGLGLTFGVELASSVAAEAVVYLGLERGLSFTRSERTLCLSPPLIVTPAQLELAFEILDDAIGEAETAAQSQAEGAPPG